ncbi:uncharacterized protein LOC106079462 isoform X2 [Biomphalaria glabrata]|uniref:Uncharacterized protein LOC106079462 isoform X2 n=1 Tax=Biomphalaria glabrata TaxID=6526 RepID=A0A9W2YKG1_BIOGL|nr:uncharacterized protein LOC106079462 isoform X2 [Biomphalaria glabrata]
MSKRYVDNPMNRRLGRVGMVHGTAVHSNSHSSKTYVDNSLNRSLARVGLPHGSAVHSVRDSSNSKTYVDNSLNQSLGRDGLPHGTAVQSSCDGKLAVHFDKLCLSETRVYKDNDLNRRLGRVGKPLGSMPQCSPTNKNKVYVDNYYNRKHNRVGKPLGSVPISRQERVYKDSPINRKLGRVGLKWENNQAQGKSHAELLQKLWELHEDDDIPDEFVEKYQDEADKDFIQTFHEMRNRENHIRKRLEEAPAWDAHHHTSKQVIDKYRGKIIKYDQLKLVDKIGHGGFGDVFAAEWIDDELVAVKKLRNQQVSKKRLQLFEDEIIIFCKLDHPNIVKFLGACVEAPNLAIVMEYMDMSLHEALHIKSVEFLDVEKTSIMRDIARGLAYLHDMKLAHCDLKSVNVLLNNLPGQDTTMSEEPVLAKITDFGLSLMKSDSETSGSNAATCNVGTPRYSAPEVLRGEMLNIDQLMKADIYSLGLVILELLLETIAFEDLSLLQLRKQVGENGLKPEIPDSFLKEELEETLCKCWCTDPNDRPNARDVSNFTEKCKQLYVES